MKKIKYIITILVVLLSFISTLFVENGISYGNCFHHEDKKDLYRDIPHRYCISESIDILSFIKSKRSINHNHGYVNIHIQYQNILPYILLPIFGLVTFFAFSRKQIYKINGWLVFALIVFPLLAPFGWAVFLTNNFALGNSIAWGLYLGLLIALIYSLFNKQGNKKLVIIYIVMGITSVLLYSFINSAIKGAFYNYGGPPMPQENIPQLSFD